jgi:hypothetical protein
VLLSTQVYVQYGRKVWMFSMSVYSVLTATIAIT